MRKIRYILSVLIISGVLFSAQAAYAGAWARYNEAVRYIKAKQPDFAFMGFRDIVRDFPKSGFAQKAVFAIAEYYYDHRMYYDAIRSFTGYINDYPGSKANTFAKVYLLKITQEIKDPTPEETKLFEDLRTDFFSKPLFLLFSEYKETSYRSPSQNKFKIRYYIDNVEVYRNGQPFIKITQ